MIYRPNIDPKTPGYPHTNCRCSFYGEQSMLRLERQKMRRVLSGLVLALAIGFVVTLFWEAMTPTESLRSMGVHWPAAAAGSVFAQVLFWWVER